MKEKVLKALKVVLIIFGVLFLIQILIFLFMMIGIFSLSSAKTFDFNTSFDKDINKLQSSSKPKEIQPIVDYVEDYQAKNKKYPEKLENVKVKDKLDYKYEVTKDGNCYTVTVKEKNTTKQYQRCKISSDNSSSTSESYAEYSGNAK